MITADQYMDITKRIAEIELWLGSEYRSTGVDVFDQSARVRNVHAELMIIHDLTKDQILEQTSISYNACFNELMAAHENDCAMRELNKAEVAA